MYKNDGLPPVICNNCIYRLGAAYHFKQQCENSDLRLRSYLGILDKGFGVRDNETNTEHADTFIKSGSNEHVDKLTKISKRLRNIIWFCNDSLIHFIFSIYSRAVRIAIDTRKSCLKNGKNVARSHKLKCHKHATNAIKLSKVLPSFKFISGRRELQISLNDILFNFIALQDTYWGEAIYLPIQYVHASLRTKTQFRNTHTVSRPQIEST